ncbi:MAG: hypothetical protein KGL39_58460 [Patescibacteria group bacterium]|nr:hypothetical protein [Patescibacteria group bacterium]
MIPLLGKKQAKADLRTKLFEDYYTGLPVLKDSVDWGKLVPEWGMMLNDKIGDCTCAGAGHLIMDWSSNANKLVTPSDHDILKAYEDVSGYNPANPRSDNGAAELDVLNYWRNTGIAGHKILAFVQVNVKNVNHVKAAIQLFGGVYAGVQLPVSAQGKSEWVMPQLGMPQDVIPGSWGGHAIPIVAFDEKQCTCITWGQRLQMDWLFWLTYMEECWSIVTEDFIAANGMSPSGFNLQALMDDLKAL